MATESYTLRPFRTSTGDVDLWVHSSLTEKTALTRLLENYRPKKSS